MGRFDNTGRVFVRLPLPRLEAFHDRLTFRDPRGYSRNPGILEDGRGNLLGANRFNVIHEYRISKPDAIRFLEVTRDENPIHVTEDIVPGAMTLSKTILPLEALLDDFTVDRVKAKFTGASFYGQRTVNHFFLEAGEREGEISVGVNTYQAGRIIAKVEMTGSLRPAEEVPSEESLRAPRQNLDLLRVFCRSLGVEPGLYMEAGEVKRTAFPKAFLASLPSGEMVRQLKGQGGMLNVLSLNFGRPAYPIAAKNLPEVQLEKGRSGPKMFNRVVTKIIDGFRTYGRGFALVHRGAVGLQKI